MQLVLSRSVTKRDVRIRCLWHDGHCWLIFSFQFIYWLSLRANFRSNSLCCTILVSRRPSPPPPSAQCEIRPWPVDCFLHIDGFLHGCWGWTSGVNGSPLSKWRKRTVDFLLFPAACIRFMYSRFHAFSSTTFNNSSKTLRFHHGS